MSLDRKKRAANKAAGRNATQLSADFVCKWISECLFQQLIPSRKKMHELNFVFAGTFIQGRIALHWFRTWTVPLPATCKILSFLLFPDGGFDLFSFFFFVFLPFIIILHLRYRCGFDTLIKIAPYPNEIQRIVNWLDSSSAHTHTQSSEIWFKLRTIEHNYAPVFDNNPFWSMPKLINSGVFIQ